MKEFIIFVRTDPTEIFFSKLRSAGLNYNLPCFFTDSYCTGGILLALLIDFFHLKKFILKNLQVTKNMRNVPSMQWIDNQLLDWHP